MENMVIDGVSARMIMAGTSGDRWEDVASDIVRKKKKKKKKGRWRIGKVGWMDARRVAWFYYRKGRPVRVIVVPYVTSVE